MESSIMRMKTFKTEIVHRVPETLQPDVLYVCFDCNVVVHLCACGCGEKVILPIDPDFWRIEYDGETISLYPSIGNFQFACKSHYWIRKNNVVWADMFSSTSSELPKAKKGKKQSLFKRLMRFIHPQKE